MNRTYMCGEIRENNVNENITLMGWVNRSRNLGSLLFMDLRDKSGIVQVVFDESEEEELYRKAREIGREYCIKIEGQVRMRSSINESIPTGRVEVLAHDFEIFSSSEVPPIHIDENDNASEDIRLKYRYLDLRKKSLMDKLVMRSKMNKIIRDFLDENNFVEFETPILSKSTPEGARDYLVPSRLNPGEFFALPQSPQIYKQLLMIGGADRYYQIARCFRDEDLRSDRQPEFTQLDIEMSFVEQEDIFAMNEKFISRLFDELIGYKVELPIKRISYQDAMEKYGSDKPDIRFDMPIIPLEDVFESSNFNVFKEAVERGNYVRGIFVEGDELFSKKGIKKLEKEAKTYGAKGLAHIVFADEISGSITKFLNEEEQKYLKEKVGNKNGVLFIVSDKRKTALTVLGNLRIKIASDKKMYDENSFGLCWVVDFPAFTYSEEDGRYKAEHHPFTMPNPEDIKYLDTDLSKVRALCYDMVINGYETGSGSIRIHESDLQAKVFNVLGIANEDIERKFGFFVEALKYGTPPHGGIAYGLDRLIMILSRTNNIRDIIAFPKTLSASCLMSSAPSRVDESQLEELSIKTV